MWAYKLHYLTNLWLVFFERCVESGQRELQVTQPIKTILFSLFKNCHWCTRIWNIIAKFTYLIIEALVAKSVIHTA